MGAQRVEPAFGRILPGSGRVASAPPPPPPRPAVASGLHQPDLLGWRGRLSGRRGCSLPLRAFSAASTVGIYVIQPACNGILQAATSTGALPGLASAIRRSPLR